MSKRLACVTGTASLRRQKRAWIISSFEIEEGHPGPFPYELGQIQIERTYRVQFELMGEGVDKEPKGLLSIDKASGTVLVHKAVDYEEHQNLRLTFESRKTDQAIDTKLGVEIGILDINDNPPLFLRGVYKIDMGESTRQGSYLLSVLAHDKDQRGSPNSTFDYKMVSVSPQPANAEFFINNHGSISFTGCLEYEATENYTLVVKAQDHGEVVSLSSLTTVIINVQDENNHLPTITGYTGSSKVLEGSTGIAPLRLHVTDLDTKGTPAWRAKFTIEGNEGGHFKIETDPETNDGILSVVKPLDFEDGAERELSVSVENEEPFFSCEVKNRAVSGLWTVDTTAALPQRSSERFIIHIEDANDPPIFIMPVKDTSMMENAEVGSPVETMTAVDLDSSHANEFVYVKGYDPDDWVTVDLHTGHITTAKLLDRESRFMDKDVYMVILYAVDNGEPPLTGTGTLRIHVRDQNDNVPQLTVSYVDMCVSDDPTTANITAFDLDLDPYGGPFLFQLLGDTDGKWSLDPSYGHSVNLVKETSVYAGSHTVEMKISDLQGQFAMYNLSVTVCDCSVTPSCQKGRVTVTQMGYGAIGILFTSLIVLLFFLSLSVAIFCGKEQSIIHIDSSANTLLHTNTEAPGTDCMVLDQNFSSHGARGYGQEDLQLFNDNSLYMISPCAVTNSYHHQGFVQINKYSNNTMNCGSVTNAFRSLLHQRLYSIQVPGEELGDYDPNPYADEGDSSGGTQFQLDTISIPDDTLDIGDMQDLSPKFNQLASLCIPDSANH
ncbi:cadherin-like protein 26 [Osmerus mordax]|uniref:cadherin-like protein 26 n=1 Tax=Osmerus mordax TaxID=8014 RepID=UPI003510876D